MLLHTTIKGNNHIHPTLNGIGWEPKNEKNKNLALEGKNLESTDPVTRGSICVSVTSPQDIQRKKVGLREI